MTFEKIIYSAVIVPANSAKHLDVVLLNVTEETNCYAVWLGSSQDCKILAHFDRTQRNEAIEFGVDTARKMRTQGIGVVA